MDFRFFFAFLSRQKREGPYRKYVFLSDFSHLGQLIHSPAMPAANAPRVLIADDEDLLRNLARRVLERAGFKVETASNSEAVLAALSDPPLPGVLVLDFNLPPAVGSDLVHKVRGLARSLPLILTSGDLLPADCKALLDPPKSVFLPKPFAPRALVETIQRALAVPVESRPRVDR